jgi:hypothetical protein
MQFVYSTFLAPGKGASKSGEYIKCRTDVLIGAVILVVAVRTIIYNNTSDRVYKSYRTAVGVLRNEFKENLDLAEKMRDEVASGTVSRDRFKTQAWTLLLAEPFLAQLETEASTDLRKIYSLIEDAETYRSQLIALSNEQAGIRISVQSHDDRLTFLSRTLDELTKGLRKHLARVREDI